MVQIENKKKKGRPRKADLASRRPSAAKSAVTPSPAKSDNETRRSLRRRTFRYNIIEYDDDYLDDDEPFEEPPPHEDEDEEEERRREKKVKLVVKLNSNTTSSGERKSSGVTRPGRRGRVKRADSDDEEDEDDEREVKKRKINGSKVDVEDDDDVDDDVGNKDAIVGNERGVKAGRNRRYYEDDDNDDDIDNANENDAVAGTTRKGREGPTPLPDKKQLELILDKLQKKDTYGVYAEPVDPDELPDYHEVIQHPMDFSTVRKKLADGLYSTLEEFECDVFLISANAMLYNASDTVYHKQARTIKELAEKKFHRLRLRIERLEREPKLEPKSEPKSELKSEHKDRPYPVVKKQMRKPFCRSTQEPVSSDFSSGATLGTMDAHNSCGANNAGISERPGITDGPIEGMSYLADHNTERAEDPPSGISKTILPKFGKRTFVVDENRRATYNISNQPVDRPESTFTTFEGDKKQLIPVGLSGEYSIARSLARFTANLGPMAWKVASKRIEQVLSPGVKYGRGWIGEYEPIPSRVLVVEKLKDPFVSKSIGVSSSKHGKLSQGQTVAASPLVNEHVSDGKFAAMFRSGGAKPPITSVPQSSVPGSSGGPANMMLKRVESNCLNGNNQKHNGNLQQQSRLSRDSVCAEGNGVRRVETSSPSISAQKEEYVPQKQLGHVVEMGGRRGEPHFPSVSSQKTEMFSQKQPHFPEMSASTPIESIPVSKNFLQSLPLKWPTANGSAPEGLTNGKISHSFVDSNRVSTTSSGPMSPQHNGSTTAFPMRQDQGLSDPVLVMKMLTENAQRQQNGVVHVHSPLQGRPSASSPRVDIGGNAAAAAASAWMSAGAAGFRPPAQNPAVAKNPNPVDSMYNGSRVFYPQVTQSRVEYTVPAMMHFPPENKGMPFQAFAPQPLKVSNEHQVQNTPMGFPQMVTNDLAKSPMQTPWPGLSPQTQQKPRQDTLPPDLNVAFQSSVDSQQPDLALQL